MPKILIAVLFSAFVATANADGPSPSLAQTTSSNSDEQAFEAAAGKYVWIDGRVVPKQIAGTAQFKVTLIGEADVTDSHGNPLGHGSYCKKDNGAAFGMEQVFLVGVKIPPGDTPTIVHAIYVKDGTAISTVESEGQAQSVYHQNLLLTQDGVAVCRVAQPITIDQWRKAGSPQ
jgi:hypothetical protein